MLVKVENDELYIRSGFFEEDKVREIMKLENGHSYILFYFHLCMLSVESNGEIPNDNQLVYLEKEFTPGFIAEAKKILMEYDFLKEKEDNKIYINDLLYK